MPPPSEHSTTFKVEQKVTGIEETKKLTASNNELAVSYDRVAASRKKFEDDLARSKQSGGTQWAALPPQGPGQSQYGLAWTEAMKWTTPPGSVPRMSPIFFRTWYQTSGTAFGGVSSFRTT